ncbi:MAG: hypothetical protein Kow0092_32210 [Deferrisomatales bacterium]
MARGPIAALWMLAVVGAAAAAPGWAADLALRSLDGLSQVRVEVDAGPGLDPVDLEVAVARRLAEAGIAADWRAPATLQVDARVGPEAVAAGVSLTQPVLLERDPLLEAEVATWSLGEAERPDPATPPPTATQLLLDRILDRFLEDWGEANTVVSGY